MFKNWIDYMYIVLLSLSFTMTLHFLRGRWWPIVCPHFCSIVTTRKGVCIYKYIVYLRLNLSYVVLFGPPVALLSNQVLTG